MKRLFIAIAALLIMAGIASAQEIRDINTVVSLLENGNALVTQTWDVTVVSGTEYYIPIDNLGKS